MSNIFTRAQSAYGISKKVFFVFVAVSGIAVQLIAPFVAAAEPMTGQDIKALNYWPNWVANSCTTSATANIGNITAGNLVPDDQLPGDGTREKIWNYLISLGFTPVEAAGIMGNIAVEGVWDPQSIEDGHGLPARSKDPYDAGSYGWGLFGFTPGYYIFGKDSSSYWYKSNNAGNIHPTKDNVYYISTEVSVMYNYMKYSVGSDGKSYLDEYKSRANNPRVAADAFMDIFENPLAGSAHDVRREMAAQKAMEDFGNGPNINTPPSAGGAGGQSVSSCACTGGGAGGTTLTGNDNQQKIFNYFIGKGLTPAQAAGIDGNFGQESGWNPSTPRGLAQWGGGRLTALEALATKQGKPVTDLGVQLDYVWLELTGGPGAGEDDSAVLQHIKAAQSAADAATIFSNEFERPGDPQLQNRIDYANQILSKYGSAISGGGAAAAAPCGGIVNCNGSVAGAAGLSDVRQNVVCLAQQELKGWDDGSIKPGFRANSDDSFSKYSQNSDEDWCADFASWVYHTSNYPLQSGSAWRVPAVSSIQAIGEQGGNFHWHPSDGSYTPKPGDLAIHGGSHVNIVASTSGGTMTLIGGNQSPNSNGYPDGSRVSTYDVNGFSSDGITGYVSPD